MKLHSEMADADWCVGDAPSRWDISFSDRLWLTLRRWFARDVESSELPTLRITPATAAAERQRRQAA